MQKLLCCVALTVSVAAASTAAAQQLTLSIADGRATLIATDVPLRQVMAEWARIGETKVVNGERLVGPNLTIQLVDRPEREVLDAVLRTAAGYVAAPRNAGDPRLSMYDRILILPTSQAPAFNPVAAAPPTFTQPRPGVPMPMTVPMPAGDNEDPQEQPMVLPAGAAAVPGAMPLPVPAGATAVPGMMPQQVPVTQPTPGMPQTLPRPGMLPQPTQMVPNPYVPNPAQQPQQPNVRPSGRPPGRPDGD